MLDNIDIYNFYKQRIAINIIKNVKLKNFK